MTRRTMSLRHMPKCVKQPFAPNPPRAEMSVKQTAIFFAILAAVPIGFIIWGLFR